MHAGKFANENGALACDTAAEMAEAVADAVASDAAEASSSSGEEEEEEATPAAKEEEAGDAAVEEVVEGNGVEEEGKADL